MLTTPKKGAPGKVFFFFFCLEHPRAAFAALDPAVALQPRHFVVFMRTPVPLHISCFEPPLLWHQWHGFGPSGFAGAAVREWDDEPPEEEEDEEEEEGE